MNAGILFYYGNYALAGKQRYGRYGGYWNGIGGKSEPGETAKFTAIRETLEEVFGVYDIPFAKKISKMFFPRALRREYDYVLFGAPLEELLNISLLIQQKKNVEFTTYEKLPSTIEELIDNFLPTGELLELSLVDADRMPSNTVPYFKKDVRLVKTLN